MDRRMMSSIIVVLCLIALAGLAGQAAAQVDDLTSWIGWSIARAITGRSSGNGGNSVVVAAVPWG